MSRFINTELKPDLHLQPDSEVESNAELLANLSSDSE